MADAGAGVIVKLPRITPGLMLAANAPAALGVRAMLPSITDGAAEPATLSAALGASVTLLITVGPLR